MANRRPEAHFCEKTLSAIAFCCSIDFGRAVGEQEDSARSVQSAKSGAKHASRAITTGRTPKLSIASMRSMVDVIAPGSAVSKVDLDRRDGLEQRRRGRHSGLSGLWRRVHEARRSNFGFQHSPTRQTGMLGLARQTPANGCLDPAAGTGSTAGPYGSCARGGLPDRRSSCRIDVNAWRTSSQACRASLCKGLRARTRSSAPARPLQGAFGLCRRICPAPTGTTGFFLSTPCELLHVQ